MSNPKKTVFISYRHERSWAVARLIFNDLREHGFDVFMDVESIDSGTFDTIILNQIAARAHFLVVLTPGTLERCKEPNDWLRREIECAIDLERNIVPILADNFSFKDDEGYLTGKLGSLSRYNSLILHPEIFSGVMDKLRARFLERPIRVAIKPTPPNEQETVWSKITRVINQSLPTKEELKANSLLGQGIVSLKRGYLEIAIAKFTEAISLKPDLPGSYGLRGRAHMKKGDLREAIADYEQYLELGGEQDTESRTDIEQLILKLRKQLSNR